MIFEDLNVVLVSLGLLVPGESRPVVEQRARDTRLFTIIDYCRYFSEDEIETI